jgi:hypothetical protein
LKQKNQQQKVQVVLGYQDFLLVLDLHEVLDFPFLLVAQEDQDCRLHLVDQVVLMVNPLVVL